MSSSSCLAALLGQLGDAGRRRHPAASGRARRRRGRRRAGSRMSTCSLFGHLLERVGEAVVGELLGDLEHALLRQVEQGVREVGGHQVGVGGDQLLGGLRLAGDRASRGPRVQRANSRRALARTARRSVCGRRRKSCADRPLAGRGLLDRDVFDDGLAGAVAQSDLAAEQLGDDAHLAAALLEAAQVDEAGGDDLAGADAGDAPDREEHAALAGDLDDQADDAGRIVSCGRRRATSRTLPTRSPAGSKTEHPASRATKTLVALTTQM